EDLGKLKATSDIGIFVGYAPNRKLKELDKSWKLFTLGLVPNHIPAAPYVPPTNKDLEILFQLMFDEYLEPPSVERMVPHTPTVQVPVVLADTPSSTIIDQDAPSPSYSPSSSIVQPPISHQGVAAGPTIEDNLFAQPDNDPFVNVFAPEPNYDDSSSGDIYKVKLDEYGDVLKNKAQLVAKGYRLKIFSGKLKSRWSGPFTISHVFPYGTVELTQPDGPNFKVNGHRIKHYFGEDLPKLVVPDL
nr:reverse transcriptase domain-containing protein [Tanacetum cinerariifolium]